MIFLGLDKVGTILETWVVVWEAWVVVVVVEEEVVVAAAVEELGKVMADKLTTASPEVVVAVAVTDVK
jgi:hypothetical protein